MENAATKKRPVTYRDVFQNGNWIRLWIGQTISQLGDFITDIAFPLLVYEITKSPVALGLGFAIEVIPLIVIGPLAGVFADRWNRRTLLLIVDCVRIFCALGMFFSTQLWQLYALALLAAIMQAIFLSTYSAVIPQITNEQFTKSISLSYMGYNTMQVIGPMVAAGIIGLVHGPRPAFIFDAATFAIATCMTLTISVANIESKEAARHFLNDLRVGLSFLWKDIVVRYISAYNVIFTIANAASALGAILYIKTALGLSPTASDQLYGIVGAILAISMALAAWLIGLLDERISKRRLILLAPIVAGLSYLLFLLHPGYLWILPLFFFVSMGKAFCILPLHMLLAQSVPNNVRGRVYSFFNAIDSIANLVAYLLCAALGLLLPPGAVLALAGAILLLGVPASTIIFKGNQALLAKEKAE